MKEVLAARLQALRAEGLLRRALVLDARAVPVPRVSLPGADAPLINLSSNDYLGLATHPALRGAAARCAQERGVGSGSARLVSGTVDLHVELEQALAALLGAERALLFGSGYLAHVGAIPALAGEGDLIYSDACNHASIVDGCRLSRARVRIYPHRDAGRLSAMLREDTRRPGEKLIVTETVFSMDGDEAPLREICGAAGRYGAWVLVDEAHAFGLRGPRGAGLAAELELERQVHARMGTLGKAAGSYGAFVAGSAELCDYLLNRARTFIYSTALPLPELAAALAATELLAGAEGDALRARLGQVSRALAAGLTAQGWTVMGGVPGPILPLLVGDPRRAVALADDLLERGLLCRAMRHPTVARGSERLRLVATAALSEAQVARGLSILAAARAAATEQLDQQVDQQVDRQVDRQLDQELDHDTRR